MAATISVSQIRACLSRNASGVRLGNGKLTTPALGTLFHRVAATLMNPDSNCGIRAVLGELEPELDLWKEELRQHTYDHIFGPLLTQRAASLQGHGEAALDLWRAVQGLTNWLCDVWWEVTGQGASIPAPSEWFDAETPLVCELYEEGWKEPVVILGQPDAVLRIPHNGRWCVLEWKTGRTSPEIDLLQACLYQLLLESAGDSAPSAIAVVSFLPEVHEGVFAAEELKSVRKRLLAVIEKLATESNRAGNPVPTNPMKVRGVAVEKPTPGGGPVPGDSSPATSGGLLSGNSKDWQKQTLQKILKVLSEFRAPVQEIRDAVVGPTFVRFFVCPQRGITVKKVMSAGEQLHLRLALEKQPVLSVDQGAIAIDLPRPDRQALPFSALVPAIPEGDATLGNAKVPLGMGIDGQWHWCDLADSESCHLLVVGTPGSGKSEWLRAALATLLVSNSPANLELLLIDPKRNAFTFAETSELLRQPIMVPGLGRDTSEILGELVVEMEQRNAMLQESNSRDLREHIERTGAPAKRVIVICDEYAALLDGASSAERKAIEGMFKRLAQIGRAPGFHLVLATQQPRANIISTAIRSLFPAKIALRVADSRESRVAIEEDGAQNLLGRGDLLYKCLGTQRFQGPWLPTEEEQLVIAGKSA